MTSTVLITAQLYENYAFVDGYVDTDNPSWKPKWGQKFKAEVSDEFRWGSTEVQEEKLREIVKEQSNGMYKYEYVSHEFLTYDIEEIEGVVE